MPIYSNNNQYPGINPHLNSALQQRGGGWKSFHAYHIIHLAEKLNAILPRGYSARPEESLQISVYDAQQLWPENETRTSIPDVLISKTSSPVSQAATLLEPSAPTLTLPIPRLLDEEDELMAIIIQQGKKPITRIELLSPANKPDGSHYRSYLENRAETLNGGLRLIEIDYLHERHPIDDHIPSYKARHPDAFPYHILVHDPRPTLEKGKLDVYSRGVLELLPIINVPLEGSDVVQLDFGEVYNHTLSQRSFVEDIDYAQEPANFAAYTQADQALIRQQMVEIATEEKLNEDR